MDKNSKKKNHNFNFGMFKIIHFDFPGSQHDEQKNLKFDEKSQKIQNVQFSSKSSDKFLDLYLKNSNPEFYDIRGYYFR